MSASPSVVSPSLAGTPVAASAAPMPASVGAGSSPAAEAPKKPHLYIGNLNGRVTDRMLAEIFSVAGPVVSAKIIQDRNFHHGGLNYGFVEFADMRSAEQALATLNGRKLFDVEIRVNWAYQGQASREDTQHHFHVFVGDLSPEVNDDVLAKAFAAFGSLSEARVMWDMNSGKSRGYGFLSFREKADAEQAINTMNGEWLGSRAIRVNWANQKTQTGGARSGGGGGGGMGGGMGMGGNMGMGGGIGSSMGGMTPGGFGSPMLGASGGSGGGAGGYGTPPAAMSFEAVAAQTPEFNTTVYVGNLIPYTTQTDLIPLFQAYGYIVEVRMQADRGFAFVKFDSHAAAANAIVQAQNKVVHGRPIKCSWGKDRSDGGAGAGPGAAHGAHHHHHHQQQPYGGMQMGYPGYYYPYYQQGIPGQPGGAQPAPAAGVDPNAAQAGQWDAAAAAAYYQSGGWGGFYAQDPAQNGAPANGQSA
ncbi:E3 ubiquitin-protein ligase pub1 [Cryptotrichosporon argae]